LFLAGDFRSGFGSNLKKISNPALSPQPSLA
jgi:hypothetical protein